MGRRVGEMAEGELGLKKQQHKWQRQKVFGREVEAGVKSSKGGNCEYPQILERKNLGKGNLCRPPY